MDFTLAGKVAIATGAAPGGIGEVYARALAQAGASVVAADVRGDEVRETASRSSAGAFYNWAPDGAWLRVQCLNVDGGWINRL